jgi:hypothetical protein
MDDVGCLTLSYKEKRRLIGGCLAQAEVGETVTYESLISLTGVSDRDELLDLIYRERPALERNKCVFDAVNNVGFRRLNDHEIADYLAKKLCKKARRLGRRSRRKLNGVENFSNLSQAERANWNASYSVAALIEYAASNKRVETVAASCATDRQINEVRETRVNLIELLSTMNKG